MVETSLGLSPNARYRNSNPVRLTVESMGNGEAVDLMLGQNRVVEAVEVAIGVSGGGYNVFALGPAETDKQSLIRRLLEEEAATEKRLSDWCYVFNFDQPNRPRTLEQSAEPGPTLAAHVDGFVEHLVACRSCENSPHSQEDGGRKQNAASPLPVGRETNHRPTSQRRCRR